MVAKPMSAKDWSKPPQPVPVHRCALDDNMSGREITPPLCRAEQQTCGLHRVKQSHPAIHLSCAIAAAVIGGRTQSLDFDRFVAGHRD
jgi:hypothetical protein